jgi:hypothetical protein
MKLTSNWEKQRLLLDLFRAGGITDQVSYVHYVRQVPATTQRYVLRWMVDKAARDGGELRV